MGRTEHRLLLRQADTRLTGTKYLWLRRPGDLSQEQRRQFRQLLGSDLKVARAWALKERFRQFWEYTYRGVAHTFFARWFWRAGVASLALYFMLLSLTWSLYSSSSSWCFLWIFAGLESEDLDSDQESEPRDAPTWI